MRVAGIEPARLLYSSADFKSAVSTNFTIPANKFKSFQLKSAWTCDVGLCSINNDEKLDKAITRRPLVKYQNLLMLKNPLLQRKQPTQSKTKPVRKLVIVFQISLFLG